MVLTRRGKLTTLVVIVVALAGVLVALALTGNAPGPVQDLADKAGIVSSPEPEAVCPLTGEPAPGGKVPDRPALAVKVENLPEVRPQYGLSTGDVIFEEPVEGGITRFIVVYQCEDAARIEPVRSARTTDPQVLVQLGTVAFGYADAAGYVVKEVARYDRQIADVNMSNESSAYRRDASRPEPHNLVSSTNDLYKVATKQFLKVPEPLFTYGEMPGKSKRVKQVELYFSDYSDVVWKWSGGKDAYLRFHGSTPHRSAEGGQVEARNVIIQVVEVSNSDHLDPAGNPVPEVTLTGKGKAYLLRDGRLYSGKWTRGSVGDDTVFATAGGQEFVLSPGKTWVELFPKDRGKPQF